MQNAEIINLILEGKKINAIQKIREQLNTGLKESTLIMENLSEGLDCERTFSIETLEGWWAECKCVGTSFNNVYSTIDLKMTDNQLRNIEETINIYAKDDHNIRIEIMEDGEDNIVLAVWSNNKLETAIFKP